MADPILTFTPQVREFVDKAMQNKTGVSSKLLSLVPPPTGTEITKYDLSEFYQLRIACMRGTADRATTAYGIKQEETGRVCDAVLIAAAEQMRKGVALDDPTHLLAPYHVSQKNRGYSEVDGKPVDVAILGARLASEINGFDESADDKVKMIDLRRHFKPEQMPKALPANEPVLLASLKGGAKDAGFTSQAAFALAYNGAINVDGMAATAPDISILTTGAECNRQGTPPSRGRCQYIGASLGNDYRREVFRK